MGGDIMMQEEKVNVALSAICASVSLMDFKTILDIVLLVVSILNITIMIIIKLVRYLKDKKLTPEEKADLQNDFNTLNDLIKKGEEDARK